MDKIKYAMQVLELANENHISINWFASLSNDFYENLWRTVYDIVNNRRKLDIYSFWAKAIRWYTKTTIYLM